jgi:hypothetical protein
MKKTLLVAVLLLATVPALAAPPSLASLALGVNGIWADGETQPWSDVEACANGAVSLQPHISAVGSVNYGFVNAYYRSTAGVRVTATDVNNRDFSVGVGMQYHLSNKLQPNEWCPDVAVGYRPWPKTLPAVTLTGLGWYGLDTKRAGADLGVRWRFSL